MSPCIKVGLAPKPGGRLLQYKNICVLEENTGFPPTTINLWSPANHALTLLQLSGKLHPRNDKTVPNDNVKHGSARTTIGFRPTALPFEWFFWVMFSKELFKTDIIGLVENPLRFFLHPREGSVHHIMVSVCRTVVLTSSRRPCAVWRGTNAVALGAAEQFCRDGDRGGGIGHVAPSEVSWRMRVRTMGCRRQSDAVHGRTGTGKDRHGAIRRHNRCAS